METLNYNECALICIYKSYIVLRYKIFFPNFSFQFDYTCVQMCVHELAFYTRSI